MSHRDSGIASGGVPPSLSESAGRLTAAMRAASCPGGPKVLRIGLVVGGRIVQERIVRRRRSVTLGPSERSTFVLHGEAVSDFKLFESIGGRYFLNLRDGMTGRLALDGAIVDLAELRLKIEQEGHERRVEVTEDVRGRITIGESTLLFQFITLAPTQARPRLPLSVKDDLASRIDWNLAVIVAFSFLVHFGAVGAIYSDWMDSIVSEEKVTASLIDERVREVHPTAVESSDHPSPNAPSAEAPTPAPTRTTTPAAGAAPNKPSTADLVAEANALMIGVLAVLHAGPNIDRAIAGESGAPVDLNEIAMASGRIGYREGLLDGVETSGPIQPGKPARWEDLFPRSTGVVPTAVGSARKVVPLPVDVRMLAPLESSPVPNAEATIHRLIEPGARRCYDNGLRVNPTQSGRLVLNLKIAANGEVDSADIAQNSGLSPDVAQCVRRVAKGARFDPPGPNGSLLSIPFNFLRQGG
jgi:outer membrane biosynthesis protein TonB